MSRKILIGCYQVPGWGGAATCAHLLFERMQRDGWDVAYVNLLHSKDEDFMRGLFGTALGNPRARPGVYTCLVDDPRLRVQPGLADLIRDIAPDLLLGFGFIAAYLMKSAAPSLPLVFLTAGARRVQSLIESGALADFVAFHRSVKNGVHFPVAPDDWERAAVELSDLIIVHSPIVRSAFEHFFPEHAGKIYDNTVFIADLLYEECERLAAPRRPFGERDIDFVFIASDWNRPIKNYALVESVVAQCPPQNVHIVGAVDEPQLPARYHGVLTGREDLYALLGRTRTLVCPSLLDAAPGVLFEASAMGCNVTASRNCGNWELCNEQLLAERCSASAFLGAMERARSEPFADRRELFLGGYADLVDTLSVF